VDIYIASGERVMLAKRAAPKAGLKSMAIASFLSSG
jgi:hypothetical protein